MAGVALSDDEKARVRHHLGYPNVNAMAGAFFGIPASRPTAFLVDLAVTNLIPAAVEIIRGELHVLDDIECKMVDCQDRLAAKSLDGIVLNNEEGPHLEREYNRWAHRLANELGVPVYHFSERFGNAGGVSNVQVIR